MWLLPMECDTMHAFSPVCFTDISIWLLRLLK
jgi:hypothetical protein